MSNTVNKGFSTIGVDIGGTKIDAALVDEKGKIIISQRNSTDAKGGPDRVIANLIQCIRTCLEKGHGAVGGIGIGMAGQIDKDSGTIRSSPNLGWKDVPLKNKLEKSLQIPVMITNDVRAATWGEWKYGAGKGIDDIVCLFIGTGNGGGIISGGNLLEGCMNTAGELGHITIVKDGKQCHCRNQGCFEAYAGGWAIAERAQVAVQTDPKAGLRLVNLAGGVHKISSITVTQAYNEGDPLAQSLVKETAEYLATGIVGIVNALNPCLVILGGGVIQGLPDYAKMIEPKINSNALQVAVEQLHIVIAALGNKAGVIGAASLARHQLLFANH
jgi:glucokinase